MNVFLVHDLRESAQNHLAIVDIAQRFLGALSARTPACARAPLRELGEIPQLLDRDARPMRAIWKVHAGGVMDLPLGGLGTAADGRAQRGS